MNGSSNSGGKVNELPDLKFPIGRAAPVHEDPPPGGAIRIIEHSKALLPIAAGTPDFEARRLALKTKIPFRLFD